MVTSNDFFLVYQHKTNNGIQIEQEQSVHKQARTGRERDRLLESKGTKHAAKGGREAAKICFFGAP